MMLFRVFTFIVIVCTAPLAWGKNSEGDAAKQFISDLGDSVVSIFENQSDAKKRETALTALFDRSIDAEWMGKFVLGKNWRQASTAQQQKFLKIYKEFLLINYLPHFKNYTGEKQKILSLLDEGDGDYLVRTQIIRPNRDTPVHVDYRVHRKSNASPFYIFDIVTEGVSVVTTHRSDFGAVITREGIDGLIKRVEIKVRSIKTSS